MPDNPAAKKLQEDWGFADAVVHGDTVWLSGVVAGLRPGETDQVAAYDRAFARIGAALAKAGVGWDDVVEMTTYHTEIADLPQFIAAKRKHVRAPYPAWTAPLTERSLISVTASPSASRLPTASRTSTALSAARLAASSLAGSHSPLSSS
jgi:enamine deaminase RidA (YjgF/YER057c/UK114 family)